QTREVDVGETVGYSNTWRAPTPRRIATVSAGYADGIIRAMCWHIQRFRPHRPRAFE
ncbi:MAG: alanine racemase, partial [Rhodobacteraceae bacterium]|nr:alanine racemase [Paracoccaceae bacterium]